MIHKTSSSEAAAAPSPGEYAVLSRATFDPRLRRYWFWQTAFVLILTVVGLAFLPFWLLGVGQIWTRKLFDSMEAELTERSLHYRKGLFFKVEKTIPLEQIQDLTIHEGPLLKALGICSLAVETAGQNTAGGGVARLTGIAGARNFRNAVLGRRDALKAGTFSTRAMEADGAPTVEVGQLSRVEDLLTEIRDLLAQHGR